MYQWSMALGLELAHQESLLVAYVELLGRMNTPNLVAETTWWPLNWDGTLILVAAIACGLAVRTLDRRARGATPDADALCQPVVGESVGASI